MRYEVNDINLSYQKDRNCASWTNNTLNGVISYKILSHFPKFLSPINIFGIQEFIFDNQMVSIANPIEIFALAKTIFGKAKSFVANPTNIFDKATALFWDQNNLSYKATTLKIIQFITSHNWYRGYPDWFSTQW